MKARFKSSTDTLAILKPHIQRANITRLAELSYLDDSSNFYVFSAVRPNAKSITTSMGKSLDKDGAKCAALMESIETYYAEEIKPTLKKVSQNTLAKNHALFIDVNNEEYNATVSNDEELDWCLGKTLLSNKNIYIPHVCLTLDSNLLVSKIFGQNSSGIASGTNYKEALIYSFLELVERHSMRHSTKKELYNVDHELFKSLHSEAFNIALYLYNNRFGLPVIECNILNRNPLDNQTIFAGYSCHFSKHEAVIKALSEALQSYIGVISGARDDLDASFYNFHTLNTLTTLKEKSDFKHVTSMNFSLLQQYDDIIARLKSHHKDVAVFTYINDDICVLKTFLITNE